MPDHPAAKLCRPGTVSAGPVPGAPCGWIRCSRNRCPTASARAAAAVAIFFEILMVQISFAFQVCPGGLPGEWGGAALSGAAPLGYPLDYHPRSVVNWLTRWTFGNSSCKPVTCSVGGGLSFCPLFEQFRPNPPLDGFGELEKICAHVSVLLSAYSQPLRLVVRLACCGYMVPRQNKAVKRGTTQSTFCTKSMEPCCAKRTWNHADKSCII